MCKTHQVNIRCSKEQHARWSTAAKIAQRKVSDWARIKLDEGATRDAAAAAALAQQLAP